MARKRIVAGNWKMNKDLFDAMRLANEVITESSKLAAGSIEVIIAPPALYLHTSISMGKRVPQIRIAAQNCHHEKSGAYTGEISATMLKSMEIDYVIIGHSERRKHFGENNKILQQKVTTAIEAGMQIIFCCGEPLDKREANEHQAYVQQQLQESLFHLTAEQMQQVVVAYEPVWAIGTGKTATPEQAQSMHAFIRQKIAEKYSSQLAEECAILYGGSVKPANAKQLFGNPDVDGGLVGGASLKKEDFMQIVKARLSQ